MNVKSLKKQLMASIAMVVVAAVALASATYAWFVTNNTVTATTSTISAQSNAAFMTIEEGTSGASTSDATTATYKTTDSIALYPARVQANATLTFETAYGTNPNDGTLKSGTLVNVGTPGEAVTKTFAKQNDFNISTKGTNLTDMKVQSVAMSTETNEFTNSEINSAVRVLIVCGDNWEVWNPSTGKCIQSKTNLTTSPTGYEASVLSGNITTGTDTVVNTYIYYDGDDTNIFTNNLSDLTTSSNVLITFTATYPNQV